jgi:hypothetical protein
MAQYSFESTNDSEGFVRLPSARFENPRLFRHPPAIAAGVAAALLLVTWRGDGWAYIDPNAGGFLSQVLAPLGAVALSFIFYCRREIRAFVESIRHRHRQIDSAQTNCRDQE